MCSILSVQCTGTVNKHLRAVQSAWPLPVEPCGALVIFSHTALEFTVAESPLEMHKC